MLSNIRDDYLLMPIDPPFIPEEKSSPQINFKHNEFNLGIYFEHFSLYY